MDTPRGIDPVFAARLPPKVPLSDTDVVGGVQSRSGASNARDCPHPQPVQRELG